MRQSLNRSVQGKAITVTSKFPTATSLHTMQTTTLKQPNTHQIHLEVSNPNFGPPVIVELHYNDNIIYVTIPPLHSVPVEFTIEGSSAEQTVTDPDLVAYLHDTARPSAQVNIMGAVIVG